MEAISLEDISLKGLKGVLFDLDDTLYPYDSCHKSGYAACKTLAFEKYKIEISVFEQYWKAGRDRVHKDLHGQGASHSRLLYLQKLYEMVFAKSSPDFALEMEELYWSAFLKTMNYAPGVETFLQKVKSAGLKTCIVTDLTVQIQMRKWQKLDLGRYIDFLVTSEEAGVEKPHAAIFKLALEKMNLEARDVVMLGDNFDKDVKELNSLGIKAHWTPLATKVNDQ